MSRRALEHQAVRAVERERQRAAAGIFVPEPPKKDPPGTFPYVCDSKTMNLGHVLYSNIRDSSYFRERCAELESIDHIIDEIYEQVNHLEPFVRKPSNAPSTAFCLLYTLFCFRPKERDLDKIVTHKDSPYIRAIGFLYLRYTADADTIWTWFSDFLDDPTPLKVKYAKMAPEEPIGLWLRSLLTDLQYCDPQARLPRIPVMKEREIRDWLKDNPYSPQSFEEGYKEDEDEDAQPVRARDPRAEANVPLPIRSPSPPPVRSGRDRDAAPDDRNLDRPYRDDGYRRSSRDRDDGYRRSSRDRDDGYRRSSRDRDDGYRRSSRDRDDGYHRSSRDRDDRYCRSSRDRDDRDYYGGSRDRGSDYRRSDDRDYYGGSRDRGSDYRRSDDRDYYGGSRDRRSNDRDYRGSRDHRPRSRSPRRDDRR